MSDFDNNRTIRMNIFPLSISKNPLFIDPESYRFTANCAPILKVNVISENAIIHVVDRMRIPVTKTLLQLIESRSDMSIFLQLLRRTKLDEKLQWIYNEYMTVFAPNDKAFEKMDPTVLKMLKDGGICAFSEF